MDIKREIVLELALEYHCVVLKERCSKDDHPLVKFADDPRPMCVLEIKKNEQAMQDRSKLIAALEKEAEEAFLCSEKTDGNLTIRHVGNETFVEIKKSVWEPKGNYE